MRNHFSFQFFVFFTFLVIIYSRLLFHAFRFIREQYDEIFYFLDSKIFYRLFLDCYMLIYLLWPLLFPCRYTVIIDICFRLSVCVCVCFCFCLVHVHFVRAFFFNSFQADDCRSIRLLCVLFIKPTNSTVYQNR